MMDGKPRGVAALAWMLGGYGFFTTCLVLAAYVAGGGDAAILVATAAASVAVPVGGLIAIAIASWQTAPRLGDSARPADPLPVDRIVPVAPPAGTVFVVGNGSQDVSVRIGVDGVSIATGSPATAGTTDGSRRDGTGALVPVTAPRGL